ncbi:MAG: DNA gyrase/topoisomerase IV subunit A [Flavobacteriaceae bacterium]|nr:DNA gyrase/topoisomerase IV subunit A [Flavobacteriaceae bacterium]MBL6684745.1 DNA gyrase/topoisomerase IV subunit A [Flavobacteriaceae bacterium]
MIEEENFNEDLESENQSDDSLIPISGMYKDWFIDYASYVILERAVPSVEDGLKPVQRRILHSMKDLDDGRFNKVANIVGHTMQYHPHGDASISDAIVQIGQKDLLIETQGNWGNILTGDSAAASRYIEARLSQFALQVVYSPKITEWQLSYDGRRKEPVNLPLKFPLLLAQGAEGIAVGLSTKVLPHNFIELIDSSIKYLRGRRFDIFPDFPTGGVVDVTQYNDGKRGGRIKVRAKIDQLNKNTLIISQIPFTTTSTSLIESILKANDKGKIKVKKIEDNTSSEVEILIHLPSGVSPDKTIDALYAFTNCEVSMSPLSCIIENHKPIFIGVSEILKKSTELTKELLGKELEVKKDELNQLWHNSTLEKIFIEKRIYRNIEDKESWEDVLNAINKGLKPFVNVLKKDINEDDIIRLTDIKIKRISKYDIDKADKKINQIEEDLKSVQFNLDNLNDYAIKYFKDLKVKYSKGRERKTEIRIFDDVDVKKVVVRNSKLHINRSEGFIGTTLRKEEFVEECSDIDDVIVFTEEGNMHVTKIEGKKFVAKNIIHAAVFRKKDSRTVYNMIYKDGKTGTSYMKRFNVTGVTRDKPYNLTSNSPKTKVLYFSSNPNGEAEVVTIQLRQSGSIKKLKWDLDFGDLTIKGRSVKGNIVTKHPVNKVLFKEKGLSTLKPRKIWFDETVSRINVENRGNLLGEFKPDDELLIVSSSGILKILPPDLSMHFPDDMIILEKADRSRPISVVYFNTKKNIYFIKRFVLGVLKGEQKYIDVSRNIQVELVSTDWKPVVELVFKNEKELIRDKVNLFDFISVKGIRAIGNQLSKKQLKEINLLDSIPYEPEVKELNEIEVVDDQDDNSDDDIKNWQSQTKLEF